MGRKSLYDAIERLDWNEVEAIIVNQQQQLRNRLQQQQLQLRNKNANQTTSITSYINNTIASDPIPDLEYVDVNGCNAIHLACFKNVPYRLFASLLSIASERHLLVTSRNGSIPLHYSVRHSSDAHTTCLIEKCPQVQASVVNRWGNTPLHVAMSDASSEIVVRCLVAAAPNTVKVENEDAKTPLDIFYERWSPGVERVLREKGLERLSKFFEVEVKPLLGEKVVKMQYVYDMALLLFRAYYQGTTKETNDSELYQNVKSPFSLLLSKVMADSIEDGDRLNGDVYVRNSQRNVPKNATRLLDNGNAESGKRMRTSEDFYEGKISKRRSITNKASNAIITPMSKNLNNTTYPAMVVDSSHHGNMNKGINGEQRQLKCKENKADITGMFKPESKEVKKNAICDQKELPVPCLSMNCQDNLSTEYDNSTDDDNTNQAKRKGTSNVQRNSHLLKGSGQKQPFQTSVTAKEDQNVNKSKASSEKQKQHSTHNSVSMTTPQREQLEAMTNEVNAAAITCLPSEQKTEILLRLMYENRLLKTELNLTKVGNDKLNIKLTDMQKQLKESQAQLEEAEEKLKASKEKESMLHTIFEKMQQEVTVLQWQNTNIAGTLSQITTQQQKHKQTTQQTADVSSSTSFSTSVPSLTEQNIQEMTERIEILKKNANNERKTIAQLQMALNAVTDEKNQLANKLQELSHGKSSSNTLSPSTKTSSSSSPLLSSAQHTSTTAPWQLQALKDEVKQLKMRSKSDEAKYVLLTKEKGAMENEIVKLRNQISQQDINNSKTRNNDHHIHEQLNAISTKKLNGLASVIEAHKVTISTLQEEKQVLTNKITDLQHQQQQSSVTPSSNIEGQYKILTEEINHWKRISQDQKLSLSQMADKINDMRQEKMILTTKIVEARSLLKYAGQMLKTGDDQETTMPASTMLGGGIRNDGRRGSGESGNGSVGGN